MSLMHEQITASNISSYVTEIGIEQQEQLGARIFPARKQLGLRLDFVKGAGGQPVVLRASAFDTKVTLRDRMEVELTSEEMPFFKEAMLVKESDRQQLNMLAQTGNQRLIDTVLKTIFDDQANLVSGAKARLEAMRMEVLATGKIAVKSNGVAKDFDYGVDDEHKAKATVAWSEDNADPLRDLEEAIDKLAVLGSQAQVLYMNQKTFSQIKKNSKVYTVVSPLGQNATNATTNQVKNYLLDELGVRVAIVNETYIDDEGKRRQYFPDGRVTLAPNNSLGYTVFGTTPEESDLVSGNNLNVSIVETGMAVTTEKTTDPVNVQTKVSMIALPSFESLDQVLLLDVSGQTDSAREESGDTDEL